MSSKSSKSNGKGRSGVQRKAGAFAPVDTVQSQLQAARSQLLVYAKDLKQMLEKEERKTQQLKQAHAQLLAYAKDLKTALDAEQHKKQ